MKLSIYSPRNITYSCIGFTMVVSYAPQIGRFRSIRFKSNTFGLFIIDKELFSIHQSFPFFLAS